MKDKRNRASSKEDSASNRGNDALLKYQVLPVPNLLMVEKRNTVIFVSGKYSSEPVSAGIISNPKPNTQTIKENNLIKQKMKEYNESIIAKHNNKDKKYYNNVITNLKSQAARINLLLARKNSIVELTPLATKTVNATKLVSYNAKISCKKSPVPFNMNIIVRRGLNNSCLYFSFYTERPDAYNCDKLVILSKERLSITLIDKTSKGKTFNNDWIYFGLETQSECCIEFKCFFGKCIQLLLR